MPQNSKVKIALFSGGSGNIRFVNLINNLPGVELSILVNGYDDGKSTGEIRKYIPGILGPSDFRKNISHLIDKKNPNGDVQIKIVGLRPGEKLYEELLIGNNPSKTIHPKIKKINDIGCCYFQFYKGLKNKKKYNYFGYDIEEKFIKLGLKKFPELYKNYKIGDVTRIDLRNCDCSIVSAIIEHVQNPYRLIEKICKSSKKILVVRTYLGIRDEILLKKNSKTPYYFNQLSKDKVKKKFKSFGFNPIIILDEATKFSRTFKIINNTHKRRMYIILAIKNHG